MEVVWDPEKLFHLVDAKDACKGCGQPFVDGCEEDQHASASDVEKPVRSWPFNFGSIFIQLVWFSITVVIDLLADAGNDQHWRL